MANILLVEDDPHMAAALHTALERAGHSVITVGDGSEALKTIGNLNIDLVVADICLPYVDGLELIRDIRRGDQATGIIAISGESGWTPGGYLRAARAFGANHTFKKPFSMTAFIQAVDTLLTAIRPPRGGVSL